jgi:thiol-disulfide isomerase/thioredoxin
MKQQCHMLMIYLSWLVYGGGLIFLLWQASWLFAAGWLVAGPAAEWLYIRYFPKYSAVMGYGTVADEPTQTSQTKAAQVTLYTALGCPFCPLIEQRLEELHKRLGFSLLKIDVTLRPDLLASKGIRSVPALEIGDRFLTGLMTSKELAEAITRSEGTAADNGIRSASS